MRRLAVVSVVVGVLLGVGLSRATSDADRPLTEFSWSTETTSYWLRLYALRDGDTVALTYNPITSGRMFLTASLAHGPVVFVMSYPVSFEDVVAAHRVGEKTPIVADVLFGTLLSGDRAHQVWVFIEFDRTVRVDA